ncbi:MAG: hypothetical protein EAZ30_08830 [Betaproteobacteria bacterium]|nr:MAG: hypothetical protein EAZ30_08830 [Betaproteobacteria bacterium]
MGSVIAGGKFANGAMTGAFAWLYNDARDLEKRDAGSPGGDGLRRSGNQPHSSGLDSNDPRVRMQAKNEALEAVANAVIMTVDAIKADIQASGTRYSKGRYNFESVDQLKTKFDQYTVGGVAESREGLNGIVRRLPDGTVVHYRNDSKFGGPAIDIKPVGSSEWRVHLRR